MKELSEILKKLRDATTELTSSDGPFEIQERQLPNGTSVRFYPNAPETLKDALDSGRAFGEKIFLTYGSDSLTFNDFFDQVDRLSHFLIHKCQIKQGDRLAIAMRNNPEWMISFAATISIGAIAVPLNSWGKTHEIKHGITDSSSALLFCDEERFGYIRDDLGELSVKIIIVRSAISETGKEIYNYSLAQKSPRLTFDRHIRPFDDVMIMYTSGTTGQAKGAVSTNFAITQALYNFELHATLSAMANPKLVENMISKGFPPCTLLAVPLFHVSGCHTVFMLSLRGGRKISMMYKWNPNEALRIIERERITTFTGAPIMSVDLLSNKDWEESDTRSLFAIGIGGAACPSGLADLIYSKIQDGYPGTGYGLTETNATCSNFTGEAFRLKPEASGTVSPIVDLKTIDDNAKTLSQGETGELCIKSPTNMRGYWNFSNLNEEPISDGWVRTGDIGFVDDSGLVHVIGRIKDVIIRGGENIYPAEIEAILSTYPSVTEVAVYGIPDKAWGEIVGATVVCETTVTVEKLQAHVGSQLATFKVPEKIHISKTPLERNASGKLMLKNIKERSMSKDNAEIS